MRRILVSRTDRIGDVVLTLPLCGALATRLGAEVVFLGRAYTRPVVEGCRFVHSFLDWDEVADASPRDQAELLRSAGADTVLHVFPRSAVARAAWRAGIPRRVGTANRLYHWLWCNRLPRVARRGSDKHEAQLNLRLAAGLLGRREWALPELLPLLDLRPTVPLPPEVGARLAPGRYTLVVHPKSAGSAREWPLDAWRALVEGLDPARFRVLVTGSPAERELLAGWLAALPPHAVDLTGRLSLPELIALLAAADGMVAASTGPLHLAAALGIDTLGLFSPTRPIHPGRWGPLGPRAEVLAAPEPCAACRAGVAGCGCMAEIAVGAVRARVEAWEERRGRAHDTLSRSGRDD